jgi:predicted alpha/beta hydrolase
MQEARPVSFSCADGVVLGGHLWPRTGGRPEGAVVINPATGVLSRYYHYYARFLAGHGYDVLTYDYRGIGLSRPDRLRGCGYRWRHWGERDTDAAITFLAGRFPDGPLSLVGHSIGGVLPGLAPSAKALDRILTVGAQYAYWPDYAAGRRLPLILKWHLAMPALTSLLGYFPGRRLGWLEDLPAGVAHEWSFRGRRFEDSHPAHERESVRDRFAAVTADILAVTVTDDEFATKPAVSRALDYFAGATRAKVMLEPADYDRPAIGHFDLFHSRHANGFWLDTLLWLRDGINPWPNRRFE